MFLGGCCGIYRFPPPSILESKGVVRVNKLFVESLLYGGLCVLAPLVAENAFLVFVYTELLATNHKINTPLFQSITAMDWKDFLAGELDHAARSALSHLREMTPFCRVLGSYARNSTLVGPIVDDLEALAAGRGSKVRTREAS